jgi:uridine kinase
VTRQELLDALAARIVALSRRVRVAVDGIDASGKTTLADELAAPIEALGRPVIRASIDGFHRPRVERYRRGATSPKGYYRDAFDYPALCESLLLPLGPGGSGGYRRAIFDYHTDLPTAEPEATAPPDAVLVVDGVFLLRPELTGLWDYRIFVAVPFEVALARALRRDLPLFGSAEAVHARYTERYIPAQRLYFEAAHPQDQADAVVYNEDPANPTLVLGDAGL